MTRVGIYINNRAVVFLGEEADAAALPRLARDAEQAGFAFVAVGDSVLAKPRLSPIPTLAAIAGATERIALTTGILQPHLRSLPLLAQEWATLDLISGGRTTLGVGLGTGPRELVDAELALAGLTRARRARAFEEAIAALRLLWAGPASFAGEVYRFDGLDIGYRPAQAGGPPISIASGGYVPRVAGHGPNDVHSAATAGTFTGPLHRVGRLGDGWITGMATPAEWRAGWEQIVAAAQEAGRDVEHAGFERRLNCCMRVDADAAGGRERAKAFLEAYHRLPMDEQTLDRWLISGPAEACAERLASYVEAGVSSFQLVLADADQRGQLERIAASVLPALARVTAAA